MATIENTITGGEYDLIEVASDPSAGAGTPSPLGSLAIVQDVGGSTSSFWQKTGLADTAWTKFVAGDAGGLQIGFTWGRSGSVNNNTWFLNDAVPSNITGRVCFLTSASILKIFIANQAATAGIELEVYTHDGNSVNLTLIGSVTTVASRSNSFTVSYSVPLNKQIAMKISNTSVSGQNMIIGCLLKGSA